MRDCWKGERERVVRCMHVCVRACVRVSEQSIDYRVVR